MFCSTPTLAISFVSSCPWAHILWRGVFLSANKIILLMSAVLLPLKQTYKWENGFVPFSFSFPMIKNKIVSQDHLFSAPLCAWRNEEVVTPCRTKEQNRDIWMSNWSFSFISSSAVIKRTANSLEKVKIIMHLWKILHSRAEGRGKKKKKASYNFQVFWDVSQENQGRKGCVLVILK